MHGTFCGGVSKRSDSLAVASDLCICKNRVEIVIRCHLEILCSSRAPAELRCVGWRNQARVPRDASFPEQRLETPHPQFNHHFDIFSKTGIFGTFTLRRPPCHVKETSSHLSCIHIQRVADLVQLGEAHCLRCLCLEGAAWF